MIRSTTSGEMCMCVSNAPRSSSRARSDGDSVIPSAPRSASATCDRCVRIAACAASGSPAATASTIACVLAERALAAPGQHDRAVLEADELGLERRDQPGRGRVTGDLEQPAVEHGVLVRGRRAGRRRRAGGASRRGSAAGPRRRRRRPQRRVPRGQPLEHRPGLEDLDRLAAPPPAARGRRGGARARPVPRARAAPAPCGRRSGPTPSSLGQIGLDQALARLKAAGDDRLAQLVFGADPIGSGRGRSRPESVPFVDCQQSC